MDYLQDFKNLEIPIGASKDEIKSAYKRLSKKYHPDKNNNCDYSEFVKVSESYQRLMNIYDYKIDIEDYEFYINNYISIIKYLYEVIRDKLVENTSNWFTPKQTIIEKTKDILINLDVDLVDIYKCEVKKVKIKVLRKENSKENNKLTLKKEDFYISLFDYKKQYIFKSKADDDLEKQNGDIIININIINKDGYYIKNIKDEKYNLYYDMEVSLYEYLFGINKFIKILDMTENIIELDSTCLYKEGRHIVNNKGILYKDGDEYKHGNFIINFKISAYNKNLELNSQFKNDNLFKENIIKYF
tara:strand:- start:423 stop:1325 length:903 start_codon:yes stop_codon:yes gene_type:complete